MRATISIFLAALVLLMISSHDSFANRRRNYPERPPEEIRHALGTLRLNDFGTGHVSVTFWSSDDAASRIENIREAARARSDSTLTHIGVNLTDNRELFEAFLKRDRLAGDSLQLLAAGEDAERLREAYGYRTVYK